MEYNFKASRRIITKYAIMILCLFMPGFVLNGQTFYFDRYGVNEGLGSSKVYTIIQDRNDYLWLGTETGLSRFGGRVIENFSADDGLSTGGVYSIFEDRYGDIWFGHLDGGLSIFDGKNFYKISLDTTVLKSDITSINELDGRIWLTTRFDGAISARYEPDSHMLVDIRQFKGAEGLSDQVAEI
jgi:ligand-binding sensor domain-containing protein